MLASADGNGNGAERIVTNVWFTLLGRAAALAALPLLAYMGKIILDVQGDVRVLNATIGFSMSDRYRGSDAARDLKLRDLEIDTIKQRLSEIERVVRGVKP